MRIDFTPEFRKRFRLGRKLGAGAMGVVYAAMDKEKEEQVAIKVLNPKLLDDEGVARFQEEARVTAQLDHPGIVRLYESGFDGQTPYMVFELIKGFSLRRYVRAKSHISVRKTLRIGHQIALALDYAHQKGVIHRDIKPDNILIADKDTIKLADFGIARALSRRSCKTKTGLVLGTVAYMAPEQISEMSLTPSVDIYGLGVVLYECLAGHQPFKGRTIEVAAAQIKQKPPPLNEKALEGNPEVATLIEWALRKDPKERIPSAIVFAQRIEAVIDGLGQKEAPSLFSSSSSAGMMLKDLQGVDSEEFKSVDGITIPTAGASPPSSATLRVGTNGMIQLAQPEESNKVKIGLAIATVLLCCFMLVLGFGGPVSGYTHKDLKVTTGTDRAEIRWTSDNPYPSLIEYCQEGKSDWKVVKGRTTGKTKNHRVLLSNLLPGNWSYRLLYPDSSKSLEKQFYLAAFGGPQIIKIERYDSRSFSVHLKNSVPLDGTATFIGPSSENEYRLERSVGRPYEFDCEDRKIRSEPSKLLFRWRISGKGATGHTTTVVVPSFAQYFQDELNAIALDKKILSISRDNVRHVRRGKLKKLFAQLEETNLANLGREFLLFSRPHFTEKSVSFEKRLSLYEDLAPWLFLEEAASFAGRKELLPAKLIRQSYIGWLLESSARTKDPSEVQLFLKNYNENLTQSKRSFACYIDFGRKRKLAKEQVVLSIRYRVLSRHTYLKVRINDLCSLYLGASAKSRKDQKPEDKGLLVKITERDFINEAFFLPIKLFRWETRNHLEMSIGRWPSNDDSPFYGVLVNAVELRGLER